MVIPAQVWVVDIHTVCVSQPLSRATKSLSQDRGENEAEPSFLETLDPLVLCTTSIHQPSLPLGEKAIGLHSLNDDVS